MTERGKLLTSIDRLKKAQDAAKKAAQDAKEEIEREREATEGGTAASPSPEGT